VIDVSDSTTLAVCEECEGRWWHLGVGYDHRRKAVNEFQEHLRVVHPYSNVQSELFHQRSAAKAELMKARAERRAERLANGPRDRNEARRAKRRKARIEAAREKFEAAVAEALRVAEELGK